jgi:hypothetical protein
MDYTVIMNVRHQFGDERKDPNEHQPDLEAPFAGTSGEFSFSCPKVNPAEASVLEFQHRGATHYVEHPVFINGVRLFGGVPAGPRYKLGGTNYPMWSTRTLLVGQHVLQEMENTLRYESQINPYTGNWDNFTIDNVVIFFKTRRSGFRPQLTDDDAVAQRS